MEHPISFFVAGIPKPAGSKRGFYIKSIQRVVITDDCKTSRDWKTDVKYEAQRNYSGPLWEGALEVNLVFRQLRPKSHYRTGANAHLLRENAPKYPTSKPDVLKLARGVEDALTGVIWKDDSQIVRHKDMSKIYTDSICNKPGCHITIQEAV